MKRLSFEINVGCADLAGVANRFPTFDADVLRGTMRLCHSACSKVCFLKLIKVMRSFPVG